MQQNAIKNKRDKICLIFNLYQKTSQFLVRK